MSKNKQISKTKNLIYAVIVVIGIIFFLFSIFQKNATPSDFIFGLWLLITGIAFTYENGKNGITFETLINRGFILGIGMIVCGLILICDNFN